MTRSALWLGMLVAGSRSIDCAADACSGATAHCGASDRNATCEGEPLPTLDCGDSCDCSPCA